MYCALPTVTCDLNYYFVNFSIIKTILFVDSCLRCDNFCLGRPKISSSPRATSILNEVWRNERVYERKKRIKNLEVLVPNKSNKTVEQFTGICTVRLLEAYIVLDA